jgi:hypothetical protein
VISLFQTFASKWVNVLCRYGEVLLRRQAEAAAEGESLNQYFSNRNILLAVAFVMLVVGLRYTY